MVQLIKLSDKFTIYKSHDENFPNIKNDCIKYAKLNDSLVIHPTPQNKNKSHVEKISGKKFKNYAEHFWIYTQTKGFNLEWMHQHLLVHPPGVSLIKTDYTFTYYFQTPTDISGDEGHIVFETEDGVRHKFLPQEGDIFIFPADIKHTAIPTPNSELDRIVYAGNLCLDIENQVNYRTNVI